MSARFHLPVPAGPSPPLVLVLIVLFLACLMLGLMVPMRHAQGVDTIVAWVESTVR